MTMQKNKLSSQAIALLGVMLGFRIALSFIPSINFGFAQWGIGFIGNALSGALFGPFFNTILGTINDIITALIKGKNFFFGFTLSAAISALIYGFMLYKKKPTLPRIFITVLAITLFVNLGLNTLWLNMMTGKAFMVLLVPRIYKNIFSLFANTAILYVLLNHETVKKLIEKYRL